MKTERKMLVAFLLNFGFALLEMAGGIFTGSIAILSDALHDLGDTMGILLACSLEKKSKQKADESIYFILRCISVLAFSVIRVCQHVKHAVIILADFYVVHKSFSSVKLGVSSPVGERQGALV